MTEILERRMPFIKLDSLTVLRKQRAKVFKPVEPISLLDWVARCLLDSDKSVAAIPCQASRRCSADRYGKAGRPRPDCVLRVWVSEVCGMQKPSAKRGRTLHMC